VKIKEFAEKRKYEIISFLFFVILIPAYYYGNMGVRRVAYAQYLADINIGFNSHTLIGTFLNLFGSTVSPLKINILGTVMSVITAFLASLVVGNIVRIYKSRKYNTVFSMIVSAFAFFSPLGLTFAYVMYGLVDIFWASCMLGSLLCLKKQWSRWLIPILSFIGVWLHYGYALAFVPFITLILLFECSDKEHRAQNIGVVTLNTVVSYGFTAYCIFFAKKFVKMTSTQAIKYLDNKFTGKFADYDRDYIMAFFYNARKGTVHQNKLDILKELLKFSTGYGSAHYETIVFFILTIPAFICCIAFSVKLFKASKDSAFRRFIRLCSIGIFIAGFAALLVSTDYYRFVAETFMSYNLFLTYLALREDEAMLSLQQDFNNKWKNKRQTIFGYALCFGLLCAAAFFQ
jgi:hypothetical protein